MTTIATSIVFFRFEYKVIIFKITTLFRCVVLVLKYVLTEDHILRVEILRDRTSREGRQFKILKSFHV